MLNIEIKTIAERNGVSQAELARLSATNKMVINDWWHQRPRNINLDVLERVANALGVSAKTLIIETK